ncbi:MAG TPA: chemotaxis protein CheW [Coriobacteriia bacterium]
MAGVSDSQQYVLFRLGPEEYGLPIAKVSSIIRYEPATPVPRAPASIDGVINLRGRVIPIVNLSQRLFGTDFEPTSTSRIVVAEGEGGPVGLAVDGASEVATIAPDEIMPPPETVLTTETAEAFQGVARYGERLVILLDLDKALPRAEYETQAAAETSGGDADG